MEVSSNICCCCWTRYVWHSIVVVVTLNVFSLMFVCCMISFIIWQQQQLQPFPFPLHSIERQSAALVYGVWVKRTTITITSVRALVYSRSLTLMVFEVLEFALWLSGVAIAVVVVGILLIMLLPSHRARLESRHSLWNPIPSMLHYRFPYTGYKVNLVIISSQSRFLLPLFLLLCFYVYFAYFVISSFAFYIINSCSLFLLFRCAYQLMKLIIAL